MKRGVGLDTCVVLRLLTGTPKEQSDRANAFLARCFARAEPVLVNDLVVAEVYHALLHFYAVPFKTAINTLRSFLETPGIHVTGHASAVLAEYNGEAGAGLVDRLIRADLLNHAGRLVTFDKDFRRLPGVTEL